MLYFLAGSNLLMIALIAFLVLGFWKLYQTRELSFREERTTWASERHDLLDRCMTKEWQSYAQVQAGSSSPSPFGFEDLRGDDDAELGKLGHDLNALIGEGEPILDMSSEHRQLFG